MKTLLSSLILLCVFTLSLTAQNLPVRTVTVFKNGRSLLQKSGRAPLQDGRYTITELPAALFGTFWVGSADGSLQSVFSVLDSVDAPRLDLGVHDILRKNLGKPLRLHLEAGNDRGYEPLDGVVEKVYEDGRSAPVYVFRTAAGHWLTLMGHEIHRAEFSAAPDLSFPGKKAETRLELRFKPGQRDAVIDLSYLVEQLGWTPIYRLELSGKNRGRLALRAEIVNDAEDLGDAELRLAVGVPNFAFADRPAALVSFGEQDIRRFRDDSYLSASNTLLVQQQMSFSYEMPTRPTGDGADDNFAGSQAEDFYFYSVRPGNFPKQSRYQFPIFEADVQPTHFYECVLPAASPGSIGAYRDSRAVAEARHPVFHYIEFKNQTKFPWTAGAVNLLSQNESGLQPVSQDLLPYTAPGATCKVKIAQTPEIKITQAEGDVDRQENAKKFFSTTYDKVKIEAQVCAINYGDEPVTLKIRRSLEGQPLTSEQKWTTQQEQATLRVNPAYTLEWVLELKPGEERKWTYAYEVFVNM